MVQIMMSSRPKVKMEECFDSCHSTPPLPKRAKFMTLASLQCGVEGEDDMGALAESSPLGLRLKKSPSFLDFIKMRLSQQKSSKRKKEAADKLKASNFPASFLKIGTWEYKSRYEGDLVGKCYFAKHKLVWEMLDGGLKNKIEIQWSDIVAIKATYSEDGPDALDVVLARRPLFFRETNPQPRKHTLWKATSDFTGGQASLNRRHLLQCPPGLLGRHFEKLVQCDPRLRFLSQQPEIFIESPYFEEPRSSMNDDDDDDDDAHGSAIIRGLETSVPATTQTPSSAAEERDLSNENPEDVQSDTGAIEKDECRGMMMGMHPSASMSDLLSRIGHCISQEMETGNLMFSADNLRGRDIMGEFAHCLSQLNDNPQLVSATDEQQIMSRVNSLCCLLQIDSSSSSVESKGRSEEAQRLSTTTISRNDSLSDLLLALPRIASLPQFLPTISEDCR